MVGETFVVSLVKHKTSFLYIPDRWAKKLQDLHRLEDNSYLKMIYDSGKIGYFSWQPSNVIEPNCIGMNASIANNLLLKEGDHVSVIVCDNPIPLQAITVCPLSSDDLEMIESSSAIVQSSLLNQVRIVYLGQQITVWISNTLPVIFQIDALMPCVHVGRLEQMTEMTVGFPGMLPNKSSHEIVHGSPHSLAKLSSNSTQDSAQSENLFPDSNLNMTTLPFLRDKRCIFRVHPLPVESPQFGSCDVFISKSELLKITYAMGISLSAKGNNIVCKMLKLHSPVNSDQLINPKSEHNDTQNRDKNNANDCETNGTSIYVRLRSMSGVPRQKSFEDECVFISNKLRKAMCLDIGSRIKFVSFYDACSRVEWKYIDLHLIQDMAFTDFTTSLFRRVNQTSDGLFFTSKMPLTLSSEKGFIDLEARLQPPTVNFVIISSEEIPEEKFRLKFGKISGKQHKPTFSDKALNFRNPLENLFIMHLDDVLRKTLLSLETCLGYRNIDLNAIKSNFIRCNVLVMGKRGSGRTSTAHVLCYILQKAPYYTHFTSVKCRPLRGKKVETIFKTLHGYIADCIHHQPSILIFDDLDSIAGVAEELDQNNPRGAYFNRIAKMLVGLLSQVQLFHKIAVIATAPSTSCLSSSLIAPRGVHFFNTFIEQPELSKDDRQGILSKLLAQKVSGRDIQVNVSSETLSECALKAEGYSCQDLSDVLDKAMFAAYKKRGKTATSPIIAGHDVLSALAISTPMLLRGVSLHKESSHTWEDVGGLSEVKKVLREVLQWPAMYPSLFSNSPLRHQSGLLLYGAPGTGKTLLAATVANECGLNFISIKGPELLSKYIGASEASVRNIFQRAQSAKPCILFFDEFDSLAPRRGHDSTGVTDRVVNQLLTQLDGVESLSGVWVLAATSRPDLLDPALLRPGRLDRSVLCPLPTKDERQAILSALSRKLCMDGDVDLAHIADGTDWFTGADLQSVLYTAQLYAVEECQSQLGEIVSEERNSAAAVVRQTHLIDALKNTRPSLSLQERLKYSRIYEKFRGRGNLDVSGINSRATLA